VTTEHDPYVDTEQSENSALRTSLSELQSETDDKGFVWLLNGKRGRRFVYRILAEAKIMHPSFSPNAMQMAKQEGEKAIGYWIFSEIQRLCPASYQVMMQENQNG